MQKDTFRNLWQELPDSGSSLRDSCWLVLVGFFIGLCAGAVISVFRITTDAAYSYALAWTGNADFFTGLAWFILAGIAAFCVGRLVRNPAIRFGGDKWIKDAIASGQPHAWRVILLPKFVGSWLVMAFGISVGREGPSIQMGAATALGLKKLGDNAKIERRFFILGGSAAGLAAAFSAPFAGVCYVYEVMKEKMSPSLFTFLLAGGFGVYISCTQIFGLDVMLPLGPTPMPPFHSLWLLLPLALFAGASGVAYNYLIRISCRAYASQKLIPPDWQPFFAFFGAAFLLFCFPALTGEGLSIFASVDAGKLALGYLCLFLIAKLFFTAYCYGSSIPAGLMVPVLCIGGVSGAIYADCMVSLGLMSPEFSLTCLVIGMASAFSAAERAPVTGLVLVAQLTGAYAACLGMLLCGAIALWLSKIARTKAM